jgi:hypothetical protein
MGLRAYVQAIRQRSYPLTVSSTSDRDDTRKVFCEGLVASAGVLTSTATWVHHTVIAGTSGLFPRHSGACERGDRVLRLRQQWPRGERQ